MVASVGGEPVDPKAYPLETPQPKYRLLGPTQFVVLKIGYGRIGET